MKKIKIRTQAEPIISFSLSEELKVNYPESNVMTLEVPSEVREDLHQSLLEDITGDAIVNDGKISINLATAHCYIKHMDTNLTVYKLTSKLQIDKQV